MYSAIYQSPIGPIHISSTGQDITSLSFTNNIPESAYGSCEVIDKCVIQLDEYFTGTRQSFDFPMQQAGTDFQLKVWNELTKIRFGQTISYHELSKRLGNTKAIRAAGTANGKNQIAIVVPCHRVIGANGSLVGYAGELWRKKWLLEHEGKFAHGVQRMFEDA